MDLLARLHGHDFDRVSVVVRPQNQMIARTLDIFHRAVSVARCGTRLFSLAEMQWGRARNEEKRNCDRKPQVRKGRKARNNKVNQRKATGLAEIRWQIADLVGNGAVGMVETTMEEVGKGHYLGMKYLFEIDLGG